PIHLACYQAAAEQFLARSDHHGAIIRADRHHEHGLAKTSRHAAALPDGKARVAIVLADHASVGQHEGPRAQRWSVGAELLPDDFRVVAVGNEADVLAFNLLGDHAQA